MTPEMTPNVNPDIPTKVSSDMKVDMTDRVLYCNQCKPSLFSGMIGNYRKDLEDLCDEIKKNIPIIHDNGDGTTFLHLSLPASSYNFAVGPGPALSKSMNSGMVLPCPLDTS
jgi:hypothetical protein